MIEINEQFAEATKRLHDALDKLHAAHAMGLPPSSVWPHMVGVVIAVAHNELEMTKFVVESMEGMWNITKAGKKCDTSS